MSEKCPFPHAKAGERRGREPCRQREESDHGIEFGPHLLELVELATRRTAAAAYDDVLLGIG